jgi:asparagine synthase (glutamine-hydrolysing)
MKSLFCRINLTGQTISKEIFRRSILELTHFENVSRDILLERNCAFGQVEFHRKETKIVSDDSFILLTDSRLDESGDLSDEQIILNAYKEWKTECAEHLSGDFAFCLWDKTLQEMFCARDHFGIKPLYYYFDEKILIVSSEIRSILEQTDISLTLNEQYLADTLSIVKSEHDQTIYTEIKKLPPAHSLHLKHNQLTITKYWELKAQKQLELPEPEIINRFKELVFRSVQNRVDSEKAVGAELSGGLDSSTIAAIAAKFISIKSFSHILPDEFLGKIHPFKDEREYIRQLADFAGISERYVVTSEEPGLADVLELHVSDFKYITQQNFSVFSDQLYSKVSHEGVAVLLSGFGGDEVITSKSGNYLDELARAGNWEDLKTDLKESKLTKAQYFIFFFRYILKFKFTPIYNFLRWLKSDKAWWKEKFQYLALNKEFSNKMIISKRYHQYYSRINPNLFQERNIERITHPHVSQRLEYCNTSARKYGIEYRYPFLDKKLIEFYLSMPPRLKARNEIKRYAIREAMKGFIPETIRLRNDKSGATIPTVLLRMLQDKDEIEKIIQTAKLNPKINGYIDFKEYERWFYRMSNRSDGKQLILNPGAFYNYLKTILFIEGNPSLFK